MHGGIVVLAGFALIALLLAWSRWLARRRLAAAGHLLLAAVAATVVLFLWPVLQSLHSYSPAVPGATVAELSFEQTGSRSYLATLTRLPDGRSQVFQLTGDQWRLDGRTLEWRGLAADLGLRPVFRLERLTARRTRADDGDEGPTSSFALSDSSGEDVWAKSRTHPLWRRFVQGEHAEGAWQPLADRARFTVRLAGNALSIEPANEAAGVGELPGG
jgi:hypothetical protein